MYIYMGVGIVVGHEVHLPLKELFWNPPSNQKLPLMGCPLPPVCPLLPPKNEFNVNLT